MSCHPDFDSNSQAVRDGLVNIYSTNGTAQTLLGTATTNSLGAWSANFTAASGATGFVVSAVAQNDGTSVSDGVNPIYSVSAGTTGLSGGVIAPVVIKTQTSGLAAKAFMLADAIYTAYLNGGQVRVALLPSLPNIFGNKAITGVEDGDAYCNGTTMVIGAGSVYDWDTENHEDGHYMASVGNLDQNPSRTYSFAVSDISVNGRLNGVRLA